MGALALLIATAPGASAADDTAEGGGFKAVTIHTPDPQAYGYWAQRTATGGDLNSDDVDDVWVGVPSAGGVGRIYTLNGRRLGAEKRRFLYRIDSPEPQAGKNFGFFISALGDVSGDGVSEVAVGTDAQDVYTGAGAGCGAPEPNGCNEGQGKAWVFDGVNGSVLYALDNPFPQGGPGNSARFGSRIGRAGDVNGDGAPDVILGSSGNDVCTTQGCTDAMAAAQSTRETQAAAGNLGCGDVTPFPAGCRRDQGQAFVFSGNPNDHAGGSSGLIRSLDLPAEDRIPATCPAGVGGCGNLGLSVQGPGDTNGDGVTDQLVGAPSLNVGGIPGAGRMYVVSGKDGSVLHRIDSPAPDRGAQFGYQDASPLSPGDVNRDGFDDVYGNGFLQDRAWVFNGRTGELLYELAKPHPRYGGQFGASMTRAQEYYNNGRERRSARGPLYVGSAPSAAAPPCDADGDGQVDPGKTLSVNCVDQRGETRLFGREQGRPAGTLLLPGPWNQELGSYDVTTVTGDVGPNLGWTVSAPGDLNRDGKPDYVAGAPFTNVGANTNQGVLIVYLST